VTASLVNQEIAKHVLVSLALAVIVTARNPKRTLKSSSMFY